jgi:hypothetical protein
MIINKTHIQYHLHVKGLRSTNYARQVRDTGRENDVNDTLANISAITYVGIEIQKQKTIEEIKRVYTLNVDDMPMSVVGARWSRPSKN